MDDIYVGETICKEGLEEALPLIKVSEPTVQMNFGTNTSPFAGKEGQFVTGRKIEERLFRETQRDVSLRINRVDNKEGRARRRARILIPVCTPIKSNFD